MKKIGIILAVMVLMLNVCVMPVSAKSSDIRSTYFGEGEASGVSSTTDIEKKVDNAMQIGMNIASTIGATIAVILLIIVAIKYMSAAPSDKAEIKKHMIVYVVGAVLLLCASGVLQLVKNLGDSVIGTEGGSSITVTKPNIEIK